MQVPTILIGLGGTGSKIVDQIYNWLPEKSKKLVAIHAFDTDVNDIKKLKNLQDDNITQTSTRYTVGQYLQIAEKVVEEWFPHEIRELHRKTLTDGAGQIRTVSRLAYRAAMQNSALNKLQDSIAKIERLRMDGQITSIRVMIVTTLAGGTGSGIFLQTAMYIRELLRVSFNRENVLIRGVFILPDSLVLNNTLDELEFDNVRSNAYACLKELNAIIRVTCSNDENTPSAQIEMEYRPDQKDDFGRQNLNLGFHNLPYDYCVLFDFENEDGRNIGAFKNYMNMVAKTSYLDLFSPMANNLFSRQDNQIRALVENDGLSRFCSAGMASVEYPYKDIVNYQTLKWVSSFLSDQWLAIDIKVKQEYKDYENDINRGVNREKFIYGNRYVKNIDELSTGNPFFKRIHRDAHLLDERNNPISLKSDEYIERINIEITNIFNNDDRLQGIESYCRVREEELNDKNTAIREVSRVENYLKDYKEAINKFLQENRLLVSDKIITYDIRRILDITNDDFSNYNCNDPFQLNYWVLNSSKPLHPIAVRYFLYGLINKLEHQIGILSKEVKDNEDAIGNYENKAYDLSETEGFVETAEDRIRIALKQSILKKIASANEFKLFADEFIEKSGGQLRRLNNYRQKKLMLEVYQLLNNYLSDISKDFEKYFEILIFIKNNINNELNQLSKIHDETDNRTIIYCLASKSNKEKLWDSIKMTYIDEGIPEDISKQVYMSIFLRFCKRYQGIYTSEIQENKIEKDFRNSVVGWCEKKMLTDERIDITCFEALKTEAQYIGIDEQEIDEYIRKKIQQLNILAKPYLLKPVNLTVSEIAAWGLNPIVDNHLSPKLIEEVFTDGAIIKESAFSKYEIIKEKLIYGLKAEDLIKFNEPDGAYYRAYSRVINKMNTNSNVITPHLDKRWHLPAYLPSLTKKGMEVEDEKINKAFIVGLAMGYLKQLDNHNKLNWFYNGDSSGMQIINISTDNPAGSHSYQLHEALRHNPAIVDKILIQFSKDQEIQRSALPDHKEHTFYKTVKGIILNNKPVNILQLVFSYPDAKPADSALVKKSIILLRAACEEIEKYLLSAIGEHRKGDVEIETKNVINELIDNSKHYISADKNSLRFKEWESIISNYIK